MKLRKKTTWYDRVVFLSGDHSLGDIAPYASVNLMRWLPGRQMDMHQHAVVQIIHVIEGVLEVDWGGGWTTIQPNQSHVLPPGQSHRLRSPHGHLQLGINFRKEGTDPRSLRGRLNTCAAQVVSVVDGGMVSMIAEDLASQQVDAHIALGIHLDSFCLSLLRAIKPEPSANTMDAVDALLRKHNDQALSVSAVCAAVGLSRSRLQELCTKRHGTGVAHVHEWLRLQRAAQLLVQDPERAIGDIAANCGYEDLYGFSRAFRRNHGCSPSQFRRKIVLN